MCPAVAAAYCTCVGVCRPCCLVVTFAAVQHPHSIHVSGWFQAIVPRPVCAFSMCTACHFQPAPIRSMCLSLFRERPTAAGDVMACCARCIGVWSRCSLDHTCHSVLNISGPAAAFCAVQGSVTFSAVTLGGGQALDLLSAPLGRCLLVSHRITGLSGGSAQGLQAK
jgi:hypothetical protein